MTRVPMEVLLRIIPGLFLASLILRFPQNPFALSLADPASVLLPAFFCLSLRQALRSGFEFFE